jgi:nitrogen regulatory protein PII
VELERLGVRSGLTLSEVRYSEGEQSLLPSERRESKKFQERVKLELILEDSEAEKAVNIILRHARPQSDQEGGQVAVLEINEILSVSAVGAKLGVGEASSDRGLPVASPYLSRPVSNRRVGMANASVVIPGWNRRL